MKDQPQGGALAPERTRSVGERMLQWYAYLGAPVAWAVHIGARYPLVPAACKRELPWLLHGTTALCLTAVGGAAVAAAVLYRRAGRLATPARGTSAARARYMAASGLAFGLLFGAVIVAELVPALLQDPCAGVRVGSARAAPMRGGNSATRGAVLAGRPDGPSGSTQPRSRSWRQGEVGECQEMTVRGRATPRATPRRLVGARPLGSSAAASS